MTIYLLMGPNAVSTPPASTSSRAPRTAIERVAPAPVPARAISLRDVAGPSGAANETPELDEKRVSVALRLILSRDTRAVG